MKKTNINLIPDCSNPSPDYYCTWQTQLYATCGGTPAEQRKNIGERMLFEKEKPFGWAYFYEAARSDLFLVMDDSWDVPFDGNEAYYGSLILNDEKFPCATRNSTGNGAALKRLTDRIKALGWKGLGGWVCAQESRRFMGDLTIEQYWMERLRDANAAGFSYWKVDWGKKARDFQLRKMLTDLSRNIAPNLTVEHAVIPSIIPYSDVYRTYDVPAILSIPMTMRKLKEILGTEKTEYGYMGLINCEDEVYIAAAGGFTMGVMRHPYAGAFGDGRADCSFPSVHRNLKTKMQEVTRAARWHRIAPAFGVGGREVHIDDKELRDTWCFENIDEEIEAWWLKHPFFKDMKDHTMSVYAPARISRGCALPEAIPDENGNVPYMVAAGHPNGAYSIVTLGRTLNRMYEIPRCHVRFHIDSANTVAVFGDYKNLILEMTHKKMKSVYMQDLADETAYDVTDSVFFEGQEIIIPGELIRRIGTIAQSQDDTSEPGVIIRFEYKIM
ncbi:MAG: hypothetical protein IJA86_02360 [Clostridia bacterium]|nr:hypothetical protein [Clostridia bacterium]